MLKIQFIKDVQREIISTRFIIVFVAITILFIASSFFHIMNYKQALYQYQEDILKNKEEYIQKTGCRINMLGHFNQILIMKPSVLQLLTDGNEKHLPNAVETDLYLNKAILKLTDDKILLQHTADFNWSFITRFILSFFIIVFTFNTITGEKEDGTLRLNFSNSIERVQFIISKYLSSMTLILIPYIFGIILSLIIYTLSPSIQLTSNNWLQILLFIILSILFISTFVLLGLLISCSFHNSIISLVVLLLIWIFFSVIIPHGGIGIANKLITRIPQLEDIERQIVEAKEAVWDKYDFEGKQYWGNARDPVRGPWAALNVPIENEATLVEKNLREAYTQEKMNNLIRLRDIASFSPSVAFELVSEGICGSGFIHVKNFYKHVDQYREKVRDFIRTEDAKDPESPHLYFYMEGGLSYNKIDEDDFPQFDEQPVSIIEGLSQSILYILILGIYNILFFTGAYVKFLKYDVR